MSVITPPVSAGQPPPGVRTLHYLLLLLMGVLWGLATAVFYSGYILSLRRARQLSPGISAANDLAVVSVTTAVMV